MQVNHEEVDTMLNGRQRRIEDNMMVMQQEVGTQRKGWSEVRAVLNASRLWRFIRPKY